MAGDGADKLDQQYSASQDRSGLNKEESEKDILFSCFETNARATVFIDPDRNILFSNNAGERLLSEAEFLQQGAGRLQPAYSADRGTFLEAMKTAFDGASRGAGLIRSSGDPDEVGAFSIAANKDGSAAAVTFLPPWTVGAQRAAVMFDPYDLTPAEKHIAECLISGYSLSDIAELNDISLSTVKSHVKRIYQKTLVESRIEFMNQFMLLVAVWL